MKMYQVDAFAENVFEGNPAAVLILDKTYPDQWMQQVAQENNLSETAFVKAREDGSYDLRWFTPNQEVRLCGHATLATSFVLFNLLNIKQNPITFHTLSGELKVQKSELGFKMDFPADFAESIECPPAIQEALSSKILACYKGKDDYAVILEDEAAVAQLTPDFNRLMSLESRGVLATAPGNEKDFISRGFFPNCGINEDPVTGSAHTVLTPIWANKLNKTEFKARQISARGGNVNCVLKGDRVELEGNAVLFMEADLKI